MVRLSVFLKNTTLLCSVRFGQLSRTRRPRTLARSLAPSNVSAARPKGRASRRRIINSPRLLSEVTVLRLYCSVSWGVEGRLLSLILPAVAAGRRRGVWWSYSVKYAWQPHWQEVPEG